MASPSRVAKRSRMHGVTSANAEKREADVLSGTPTTWEKPSSERSRAMAEADEVAMARQGTPVGK